MLLYVNFTLADINIELRHNVPTSQRSNNDQERAKNLMLGQTTFCRPEASQSKSVKLHNFCILMYKYEDFSNFLLCFLFAEILPNHDTVSELPIFVSPQSVPSIIDKRHKF